MENVHWLALIVGTLIPTIMGMIWYHPKVFGNAWMKSIGMTEEELNGGNMGLIYGIAFILALMISWHLHRGAGYHADGPDLNFLHGAFHGVLTAGFTAVPVLISNSLFERKNWTNIIVNALYWLATFAVMGGVIYTLY